MSEYLLKKAMDKLAKEIPVVDHFSAIYNGTAGLGYIDPEVRRLYGDRLRALNINHAVTAITPVAQRTQVAGFRTTAGDVVDDDITATWEALGLDRLSSLAQLEAMIVGRCPVMVGVTGDGAPLVTVESPRQVTVLRDPATRQPIAALKRYQEDDGTIIAILMTAESIDTYASPGSAAFSDTFDLPVSTGGSPVLVSREPNILGRIPVVWLVNQPRVSAPDGRSDIAEIEDLLAAIAKLGSDLMTASEASALPHRIVTVAGDITDEAAQRIQSLMSRTLAAPASAKVGVLSGGAGIDEMGTASLDNFATAIRLLVNQVAAISGMPPYYVNSDVANPTSADAIRSAESRITARVIERQRWWGPSYVDLMRLVQLVRDGFTDPRLERMTTLWVDPAPASIGQEADAVAKLIGANVIDRRAALESLNLPPVEIERILSTPAPASPGQRRVIERDTEGNITAIVDQ